MCSSDLDYSAKGSNMVNWLDKCFGDYICDEHGKAKFKVHGLGLTTPHMMVRYPWYSVDSTSWKLSAGFGSIFVPRNNKGKYDYIEGTCISVSIEGKKNDFENMSIHEKEYVLKYLKSIDIPFGNKEQLGVCNNYRYRRHVNLIYFKGLENEINEKEVVFKETRKGLFK